MDEVYPEEDRRPRPWLWIALGWIAAFTGGVVAMGYAVTHDPRTLNLLHLQPIAQTIAGPPPAATQPKADHGPSRTASAPAGPAQRAAETQIATRIAALEGKVGDIQEQAIAATGDASRAEGLLVAFAARRALDRGVALGYLEGLLRQRFGGTQPQAVATILSASHQPVTLTDLQGGLDAIAPTLATGGAAQQSWWQGFRQELAGMIVIRRAGEASTQPADRVLRAQRLLEAGQVDSALAEIIRLPDHRAAEQWIPAARRYIASRAALDQIETAALLDPANPPPLPATAGKPVPAPPAPVPQPAG